MKRSKTKLLNFRAPALVDRTLTYLSGMQCLGQVTVLCFLAYPRIVPAEKIDGVAEDFLSVGARFLIVASDARPLYQVWKDRQTMPRTPILGDPCGRLHRLFDVAESEPLSRCRTFVIDGSGILRLQFRHEFNDHALAAIHHLVTKNRVSFARSVLTSETTNAEPVPVSM